MAVVYLLIDPRTGEGRYVGATSNLQRRIADHLRKARSGSGYYVHRWIGRLLGAGLKPEVEILESQDDPEALAESERFFISYFRFIGMSLANIYIGGTNAGQRLGESQKAKISASRRGSRASESTKQKMSAAHLLGRTAECHSELRHYARRLCFNCYMRAFRHKRKPLVSGMAHCRRGHSNWRIDLLKRRYCRTCKTDTEQRRRNGLRARHVG